MDGEENCFALGILEMSFSARMILAIKAALIAGMEVVVWVG